MMFIARILVGALLALAIGALAYRARALSASGTVASAVMGTVAVAAGWSWAALLIAYFVASTALSRLGERQKAERVIGMVSKAGPRDGWQVLSNGGVFLFGAIAAITSASPAAIWMAIAAGSLAASAADTWATEVGTLVGQRPRSIVNGRPLAVGASGGVTVAGSLASVGGAVFVALVALVSGWPRELLVPVILGGVAGSVADSVAGVLFQRRSWCDACERITEMRTHTCGTITRQIGGLSWLENDGVNLIATIVGALVAVALV